MRTAFLLFLALATALPAQAPDAETPVGDLLAAPVLIQEGVRYTARQVLTASSARDASLLRSLEANAGYLQLYLASPRFLDLVQQFSNHLAVEAAGYEAVDEPALLAEASAWAKDRGLELPGDAILATHLLEIDWRARLVADQQGDFSTTRLRQHMLTSVPEFFGELQIAWIRLPLVDLETGSALSGPARRALYDQLDDVARAVLAGELPWAEAVETYTVLPRDMAAKGAAGIVRRGDTGRFEEAFLRETFKDLGFRRPDGAILRGPVLGQRFAYLVRIEAMQTRGVVDLERVRPQVARSLQEKLLHNRLSAITRGLDRQVLAPLTLAD